MLPWGLLHKYKGTFASPERIWIWAKPNDSSKEPARVVGICPEMGVLPIPAEYVHLPMKPMPKGFGHTLGSK